MSLPVLSLPGELRTFIFAPAVTFPGVLLVRRTEEDNDETRPSIAPQLGLLLVSKNVHDEAAALFYELNNFRFDLPRHVSSTADAAGHAEELCRAALTVPARHINRLRRVVFHKSLSGYWPDGPLTDGALGPEGLGERELATMLDAIAAHRGLLNDVVVHLQRESRVAAVTWDTDPMALLGELDRGRRFSAILGRLPQLRRVEVWKARRCAVWAMLKWQGFPEGGLERGNVHVQDLDGEAVGRVREGHFAGVKSARYERKAWGSYVDEGADENVDNAKRYELCMKEGFVLNFT